MGKIKTKNLIVLMLFSFLALFLLSQAVAAEIELSDTSQLTIAVDYKDLGEDDDIYFFQDHALTLKNTGNTSEEVTLSITGLNTNYKEFKLDAGSFSLAPDAEKTVYLSGKTPLNADQGKHENIAQLKVKTASAEKSFGLSTDVAPMLEVERLSLYVNGNKEKNVGESGKELNNLLANDKVELKFLFKNRFNEDYDNGDLEGTVAISLDDSDFGDEIDDENDFDVSAGDTQSESEAVTFSFDVPTYVEKGDYTLEISFDAEDQNSAKYQFDWDLTLGVKREDDKIVIEKLTLSPADVSCDRQTQILAKVTNLGDNFQKHSRLVLENADLGINEEFEFELEKGTSEENSVTKEVGVNLNQKNVPVGTYTIKATAYYDEDTYGDDKTVQLTVKNCAAASSSTASSGASSGNLSGGSASSVSTSYLPMSNPTDAPAPAANSANEKVSSSNLVATVEQGYTPEDILLIVFMIAVVLIIALVIVFVIVLLKR